jgi:hypothetical protein
VHAAALAREVDAEWVGRVVAAISLVGVDARRGDAGERLDVLDGGGQRVAVVGVAVDCPRVDDELAAGRAGVGGRDRGLDAELVGTVRLALGPRA